MDLGKFNVEKAADEGAELHLEHPVTGEKLYTEDGEKISIRLVGMDSTKYRRAMSRIASKNMGKRQKQRSIEKAEQEGAELLAACTVGWQNIVVGEPLEHSEEAAYDLYVGQRWIREQVDEFVADRANFFQNA